MSTPYVFSPAEANQALISFAKYQKEHKNYAIGWNPLIPSLKEAPPLFPGQIFVLHAASGEGKSSFSKYWIREVAKAILANHDPKENNKILSIVLEETIELSRAATMSSPLDFAQIATGNANLKEVLVAISDSANDPIYYIGPSISGGIIHPNATEFNGITPKQLGEAFYELQTEQQVNIVAACLDYIQIMSDNKNSSERYSRVTNASMELLNVSRSVLKCPLLVCAQSKADVKERANKIPGLYDIQHSSQIAQDADIVWSMWHPASEPFGTPIKLGGKDIFPFNDIFIINICKWRNVPLQGLMFILCGGKPFGNFFEIPYSVFTSINVDDAKMLKAKAWMDLPTAARSF